MITKICKLNNAGSYKSLDLNNLSIRFQKVQFYIRGKWFW